LGEQARGLRHGFDHQHAGHHRVAGEMALEEGLVDGHVLERAQPLVRLDLQHAIHQQERIAMRQHPMMRVTSTGRAGWREWGSVMLLGPSGDA
jgi:hypothetical protein